MPHTPFTITGQLEINTTGSTTNLPTLPNNIAIYTNSTGSITTGALDSSLTAVNVGNIQAGNNGNAGEYLSYPSTSNKGLLALYASNNAANYTTSLTNASQGQSSVITIPDPGTSSTNFILNNYLYSQVINTPIIVQSSVEVGESTQTGTLTILPSGTNQGKTLLVAPGNSNNYETVYNLTSHGQNTTLTVPQCSTLVGAQSGIFVAAQSGAFLAVGDLVMGGSLEGVIIDGGGYFFSGEGTDFGVTANGSSGVTISITGVGGNITSSTYCFITLQEFLTGTNYLTGYTCGTNSLTLYFASSGNYVVFIPLFWNPS